MLSSTRRGLLRWVMVTGLRKAAAMMSPDFRDRSLVEYSAIKHLQNCCNIQQICECCKKWAHYETGLGCQFPAQANGGRTQIRHLTCQSHCRICLPPKKMDRVKLILAPSRRG